MIVFRKGLFFLLLLLYKMAAAQTGFPKPLRLGFNIGMDKVTPAGMKAAKAAGIDCIEIGMGGIVDTARNFLKQDDAFLAIAQQAKKAADEAGIQIWSVHMPFGKNIDLSLGDENERNAVVAMHARLLKYVAVLDPQLILFHPSWYLNRNERPLRKKQLVRSVQELNPMVKQQGATMVIENMLGPELQHGPVRERPLLRTVEEAVEVMNLLPRDVYSAIDLNHIKYPEKLILAMGSRLKTLHVADGTGREENHYFPCNGKGENNWVAILQALDQVHYDGPFLYESHASNLADYRSCYQSLYAAAFGTGPALGTTLGEKNFPLTAQLTDLQTTPVFEKAMQAVAGEYAAQLQQDIQTCTDRTCYATALRLSPELIRRTGDAWVSEHAGNTRLQTLVAGLKKKETYYRFNQLKDTAYLRKVWETEAGYINNVFSVYISGAAPRYPKIDSIRFNEKDKAYPKTIKDYLQQAAGHVAMPATAFHAAIRILELNGRYEAARYEPLEAGLNTTPVRQLKKTNWNRYAYSLILVPGLGPEDPAVTLDSGGARRCRAAAELYKKGMAPFIVVSGGNVHPFLTPYNEAVEMKRYLTGVMGIPEHAVFIEPHARHTTTNIRNTNRMIYRFKIPAGKPVLIATDASQTQYIRGNMTRTSLRDLGYLPYSNMKNINTEQTSYYPNKECLQTDASDPLDP
ncbi:TIM barrel protein [Niabella beijingensis]|uniref:TIM barrel protein n=1 Tax=Niabella beijingensis TaxID=2872700 RepID=UPI001CBCF1F4|nr:TIM barrel protein [Niabella beijingensis]MBZ4191446.1 TIM barrel protein [Niabella beijingensis]